MNRFAEELQRQVDRYENTALHNDQVFAEFTAATAADPVLAEHRRYVEQNQLGFGDPAFHALWQSLLASAQDRFGRAEVLEIGVFKGQVVSLWALLAKTHGWPLRIHAITPFEGQPLPVSRWWRGLQVRLNPWFRARLRSGDFYPLNDYEQIVRRLFARYGLDFNSVRWIRGYSNAPEVLAAVQSGRFHVIYIDGSHTYQAVSTDLANYAPKVVPGGWLVMDDASYDLPGTTFWKGYESVSRACRQLPGLGFKNVLNVGHNRLFEKLG
jgi:predicted O-methyltransferase YrrM